MAGTPFKMKGFSGFGNSPLKQTTEHIDTVGDLLKKEKSKKKIKHVISPSIFGYNPKQVVESMKSSDFVKGFKQGIKNIKKVIKK